MQLKKQKQLSLQRNLDQNYKEILSHSSYNDYDKNDKTTNTGMDVKKRETLSIADFNVYQ